MTDLQTLIDQWTKRGVDLRSTRLNNTAGYTSTPEILKFLVVKD